ncbi:MAG: ImmA/IrrE family metallo-endopeptidase [Dehalococcoidia bacterium]|nr:ImmA/IrrE family metallo-endopeptidase [Dehalococcoidia bacterium]
MKKAVEVMSELGVAPPAPVDIDRIARDWGLAVEYVKRPRGMHGRVVPERAVIEVAISDHPNRQRFTLAHELGHYVLEHNPVFADAEPRGSSNPTAVNEREANYFAAVLLMPEEWVRQDWQKLQDAGRMAGLYRTSAESMWYRLEELRLIKI